MNSKPDQLIMITVAQVAVGLIILAFVLAAAAFTIFGLIASNFDPSTGETTYRVIGDTFTMDRIIADMFAISMEAARMVSHILVASLCLLVAAFFLQLFLILGSARRGDPFTHVNATRLIRMGLIVLVAGAAKYLTMFAGGGSVDGGLVIQTIMTLAIGLSFLILGQVFRLGAAMRDEMEGTV